MLQPRCNAPLRGDLNVRARERVNTVTHRPVRRLTTSRVFAGFERCALPGIRQLVARTPQTTTPRSRTHKTSFSLSPRDPRLRITTMALRAIRAQRQLYIVLYIFLVRVQLRVCESYLLVFTFVECSSLL